MYGSDCWFESTLQAASRLESKFIECKDDPDDSLWAGGDKEVLDDFHLFTGGETS